MDGSDASDWRRAPPPPEAYSRVTNPERFRPLHERALALLARLRAEYAVVETAAFAPLPDMRPFAQARPPVTLTPTAADAAPIAVAFTTFPSLVVRYGRWLAEPFPVCACDACASTADAEYERLAWVLDDVVTRGFYEEITAPLVPLLGTPRLRWKFGEPALLAARRGEGFRVLTHDAARALRGGGPRRVVWRPWPARTPTPAF